MSPTIFIVLFILGLFAYISRKVYLRYWVDAEVDSALNKAERVHHQAEKAKVVDLKQYSKDKKIVEKVKDLD